MAVTILETIKSAANAGNTAYIVILSLLCDTYSDLPTQYSLTGYELAQGCKAHVIDTNSDYMLDSSGTWHISGGEIWQNVYTKTETDTLLAGKQDTLTTAQLDAVNSGITAAKLTADEAALVELDDRTIVQKAGATVVTGTTSLAATGVSIQLSGGSIYRVTAMAKYKGVNLDTIAVKYVISGVEYLVCTSNDPPISNRVYLTTSGIMTPSSSITAEAYVKTEAQGNVEIMLLAEKIHTNQ